MVREVRTDSFSVYIGEGTTKLKQKLAEFIAGALKRKKRPWYSVPQVRHGRGEEQAELETAWEELFFDLLFVALAFKLGSQLDEDFAQNQLATGFLYFFGQFIPMYGVWFHREFFLAKFACESLVHKAIEVGESVLVAFLTLYTGTSEQLSPHNSAKHRFNQLVAFSSCFLIFFLVRALRYCELRYVALPRLRTEQQKKELLITTSFNLQRLTLCVLFTCGAIAAAHNDLEQLAFSLLILTFFATGFVVVLRYLTKQTLHPGVVINVSFIVKRFGEFCMLMLGEGVLQLNILTFDKSHLQSHFTAFGLAFFLLATTQFLIFYILPIDVDEHIRSKSSLYANAPFVLLVNPFFFASLIWLGVALKNVLKKHYQLDEPHNERFQWLLAASLTSVYSILIIQKLLHLGLTNILYSPQRDFTKNHNALFGASRRNNRSEKRELHPYRILFFLCVLLSPLLFLTLPFAWLKGEALLATCIFVLSFIFILAFVEKRVLNETDEKLEELVNSTYEEFETLADKSKRNLREIVKKPSEKVVLSEEEFEQRKAKLDHLLYFLRTQSDLLQERVDSLSESMATFEGANEILQDAEQLHESTALVCEDLKGLLPQLQFLQQHRERAHKQQKVEKEKANAAAEEETVVEREEDEEEQAVAVESEVPVLISSSEAEILSDV